MDAKVAPGGILLGKPEDEGLDIRRDAWPPAPAATAERPLASDQLTMPREDGLRREERQALPPLRASAMGMLPELGDQHRKGEFLPARGTYPARLGPVQDAKLVAQEEDLEFQGPYVAPSAGAKVKQQGE